MRTDWNTYFMSIARLVATRSTCVRRQVGCVLVKEKRILSTGYNGAPSGLAHCEDVGCLRQQLNIPSGERHEICRGVHAEQNALIQAARFGVPIVGADLYCTTMPCTQCTKMLLNAGISEVYCSDSYPDDLAVEMFKSAGRAVHFIGTSEHTAA